MRVVICEDERPTADRLVVLLMQCEPSIEIIEVISSIEQAVDWFSKNPHPDLIFQDIELSDGNCFRIFESVKITAPIIFTTAYSEYALRSFSQNSIDYLIKPYDLSDIQKALNKYHQFKEAFRLPEMGVLEKILKNNTEKKSRFLVKVGDFYKTIQAEHIAFIQSEDGLSVAYLFDGNKHLLDVSLNELDENLDQSKFFRINRSMIVHVQSILSIQQWFSGRLKLKLGSEIKIQEEVIVSRNRSQPFKEWLGK